MQAGFHHCDITPVSLPIRTYLGQADTVLDPLYAQAAAFAAGNSRFALVALDVVILEAPWVERIRAQVSARREIAPERILVCTTHNHACPAVINRPSFAREEGYLEFLCDRAAEAVIGAIDRLEPAVVAAGHALEHRASFNRRFLTRDGGVVTQPRGADLDRVLCNENVIDPEVGVLRFQSPDGNPLGVLVNFGCHAVHHMGKLSAGYPGILRDRVRERIGAEVVFLNGPCANVFHGDFLNPHLGDTKERTGGILAETVLGILDKLPPGEAGPVAATSQRFRLPYRDFVQAEKDFADPAVQRNVFQGLIGLGWYNYPALLAMSRERGGGEEVEVQAFQLGDTAFATFPAEYFMEFGLEIKRRSPFARTYAISLANGWVGYVPTQAALARKGGHETTTALWSKMCPEAGDRLADTALALLNGLATGSAIS